MVHSRTAITVSLCARVLVWRGGAGGGGGGGGGGAWFQGYSLAGYTSETACKLSLVMGCGALCGQEPRTA